MRIECRDCEMFETDHCEDCLVTALLHPPAGVVELDENLEDPLRALSGAGLIPVLRFRPRAQTGPDDQDDAPAADTG